MSEDFTLEDLPQPTFKGTVSPEELETDGENPNEQSDDTFGLLCERIRDRGWLGGPIVADSDGLIADGEHRYRAALEIGLDEVPVEFYDFSDAERRMVRQELNKISGAHDRKRDALEYDVLLDQGKSDEVHALTKAAEEDLDELLAEIKMETSRPASYEYTPNHNVYFEDCVEGMEERLDDDSVDMVFTSPPYNIDKKQHGDAVNRNQTEYSDDMDESEYREFLQSVMGEVERVVKPEGHVFVNIGNRIIDGVFYPPTWVRELTNLSLRSMIVWDKKGTLLNQSANQNGHFYPHTWEPIFHFSPEQTPLVGTGHYGLWSVNTIEQSSRDASAGDHPAPFPLELVERAMDATTSKGDTILDPFMGSGTTAVAAIQNNRDYVGFELDEEGAYKPIIERRIGEAKRQVKANE